MPPMVAQKMVRSKDKSFTVTWPQTCPYFSLLIPSRLFFSGSRRLKSVPCLRAFHSTTEQNHRREDGTATRGNLLASWDWVIDAMFCRGTLQLYAGISHSEHLMLKPAGKEHRPYLGLLGFCGGEAHVERE